MTRDATVWAHDDRGGGATVSLARVRSLIVIGVLALVAVITVVWAIVTDDQTGSRANECATVTPSIPAPSAVKMRVYNGTDKAGLANQVRDKLAKRGFKVIDVGNDPQNESVTSTAQIRYGPKGAGAAQLLQASVPGSEILDDSRDDATVDVVLGIPFTNLTPEEDVPAKIKTLEPPVVATPAGC